MLGWFTDLRGGLAKKKKRSNGVLEVGVGVCVCVWVGGGSSDPNAHYELEDP